MSATESSFDLKSGGFSKNTLIIAALLMLLLVSTRPHTFGMITHLPNASVAIFFAAGFYLRKYILFWLFFAVVMLLDYLSITVGGVSSFCVSPAYWFMIPAYAINWEAGKLFKRYYSFSFRSLFILCGLAFFASSLAFVITNGSFYLISGRYADQNWAEYFMRFKMYYPYYVASACAYIGTISCIHVITQLLSKDSDTQETIENKLENH
jgi:hypothetical protein